MVGLELTATMSHILIILLVDCKNSVIYVRYVLIEFIMVKCNYTEKLMPEKLKFICDQICQNQAHMHTIKSVYVRITLILYWQTLVGENNSENNSDGLSPLTFTECI